MGEIISSKDVFIQGLDKSLYEIILDQSSDPIFCFDTLGTYLYINLAFSKAFDMMPSEIIGKRIWDIFPGEAGDRRFAAVKKAYETNKEVTIEVKVEAIKGTMYFITTVTPILDEQGVAQAAICISKNITERKDIEFELERKKTAYENQNKELDLAVKELYIKSITDGLTGLYTRQFTLDKLGEELIAWKARSNPLLLGFMDLDFYKNINDRFGHLIGDQVLIEFSQDLKEHFEAYGYSGRYGGEEFIIVIHHLEDKSAYQLMEEFLRKVENKHFTDKEIKLTVSIGYYSYSGESVNEFLKKADDLLYKAKKNGRNRIER